MQPVKCLINFDVICFILSLYYLLTLISPFPNIRLLFHSLLIQIGYKEDATVEDKFRKSDQLPHGPDPDEEEKDDEKPSVC